MEKTAVPTGDVVKDWDIREDEKIYFLLRSEKNKFTIGLGDILECLRFAEKEGRGTKTSCRVVGKDMEHVSTDSGISRSTRRQ